MNNPYQDPRSNLVRPPTAPSQGARIAGTLLSLLGAVIAMVNGGLTMIGRGNYLVFIFGFALMLGGLGLRGKLTQKV